MTKQTPVQRAQAALEAALRNHQAAIKARESKDAELVAFDSLNRNLGGAAVTDRQALLEELRTLERDEMNLFHDVKAARLALDNAQREAAAVRLADRGDAVALASRVLVSAWREYLASHPDQTAPAADDPRAYFVWYLFGELPETDPAVSLADLQQFAR